MEGSNHGDVEVFIGEGFLKALTKRVLQKEVFTERKLARENDVSPTCERTTRHREGEGKDPVSNAQRASQTLSLPETSRITSHPVKAQRRLAGLRLSPDVIM